MSIETQTGTGTSSGAGGTVDQGREAASQVASTATEGAKNVGQEAKRQTRDLMNQTRGEIQSQANQQQQKLAGGIRSLGDELRSMAGAGSEGSTAHTLVDDAAQRVNDIADWLEQRDPGSLMQEAKDFARRKPGTFLLGAALLGVVGGRLSRSFVDEKREESGSGQGQSGYSQSGTTSGYGYTTPVAGTPSTSGTAGFSTAPGYGDPMPGIDPDPVPGEVPGTPRTGYATQPVSPTSAVDEPRIARPTAPDGTPTPVRDDGTLGVPDTHRGTMGTP